MCSYLILPLEWHWGLESPSTTCYVIWVISLLSHYLQTALALIEPHLSLIIHLSRLSSLSVIVLWSHFQLDDKSTTPTASYNSHLQITTMTPMSPISQPEGPELFALNGCSKCKVVPCSTPDGTLYDIPGKRQCTSNALKAAPNAPSSSNTQWTINAATSTQTAENPSGTSMTGISGDTHVSSNSEEEDSAWLTTKWVTEVIQVARTETSLNMMDLKGWHEAERIDNWRMQH